MKYTKENKKRHLKTKPYTIHILDKDGREIAIHFSEIGNLIRMLKSIKNSNKSGDIILL